MFVIIVKKMYKFVGFEMLDSLIDWIIKSMNFDEEELQDFLNNFYFYVRDFYKNDLKWCRELFIKCV